MSLALFSAGLSLAGGIAGASSSASAGKAAYEQGQYEYHDELMRADYDAKVLHRQYLEELHSSMAMWGASGVDVSVGSPVVNMTKTLNDLQEDEINILREGRREAHKLWMAGSSQAEAHFGKATGSLLSGIGGAAGALRKD